MSVLRVILCTMLVGIGVARGDSGQLGLTPEAAGRRRGIPARSWRQREDLPRRGTTAGRRGEPAAGLAPRRRGDSRRPLSHGQRVLHGGAGRRPRERRGARDGVGGTRTRPARRRLRAPERRRLARPDAASDDRLRDGDGRGGQRRSRRPGGARRGGSAGGRRPRAARGGAAARRVRPLLVGRRRGVPPTPSRRSPSRIRTVASPTTRSTPPPRRSCARDATTRRKPISRRWREISRRRAGCRHA